MTAPALPLTRILIITDAWLPQVNGVVRSIEGLVREAPALGVEIEILRPLGDDLKAIEGTSLDKGRLKETVPLGPGDRQEHGDDEDDAEPKPEGSHCQGASFGPECPIGAWRPGKYSQATWP